MSASAFELEWNVILARLWAKRMYGKHFASMYQGSMVGAGAIVFAVMGYVIANGRPDRAVGMQVDLNPKLLSFILGESEKDIEKAIDFLCKPDPESRSQTEGGRRLKRLGQFSYQVVNGAKYRWIRDEEKRREQNRDAQRRHRLKQLPGEAAAAKAIQRGASSEELSRISDAALPD